MEEQNITFFIKLSHGKTITLPWTCSPLLLRWSPLLDQGKSAKVKVVVATPDHPLYIILAFNS